jgi:hypothetical protein
MNLSQEQISSIDYWYSQVAKKKANLTEVQKILDLEEGSFAGDDYELDGQFAFPADKADFDPEYIEHELDPDRYEVLSEGQPPTDEELELWKKKKESLIFEEDDGWFHFYIWRVDLPDKTIYFLSLHGDGGILDYFYGPFTSEEDALKGAANIEMNPRP